MLLIDAEKASDKTQHPFKVNSKQARSKRELSQFGKEYPQKNHS